MNRRKILAGAGVALGVVGLVASKKAVAATPKTNPSIFDFGAVGDGSTDDSAAFTSALTYAANNTRTIDVPGVTYAIKKPITWTSVANVTNTWGFNAHGAQLVSSITGGQDVISLNVRHLVRYFKLTGGMAIQCSGSDGNGLHLSCYGSSIYFYNNQIDGLSVDGAGQNGLFLDGNVFETIISNSYFQNSKVNGAMFAQHNGGVVSAINVFSCFLSNNGQYGLCCTNLDAQYGGTTDVRVYGGYCRENGSYGFYYNNGTAGSTCIEQVGFENNCVKLQPGDPSGAHVYAMSSLSMRNCGGYNMYGGATYMVRGYFTGLCSLDNCTQDSGGAMAATGKSRLAQVFGTTSGFVLMRGCGGGVDVQAGNGAGWSAQNSSGVSPRGTLTLAVTI